MPRKVVISDEEIVAAVAQLTAQGKPITGWRLNRLVKGGNASRLESRAIELAAPMQEAPPEPEARPLPPSLVERLAEAEGRASADLRLVFSQAWTVAADLAAKRVAEEVNDARVRVTTMTEELDAAAEELIAADERADGLTAELSAARDATTQAERSQKAAEQAARDAVVRLDELRASLAAADARLMAVLAAVKPPAPADASNDVAIETAD